MKSHGAKGAAGTREAAIQRPSKLAMSCKPEQRSHGGTLVAKSTAKLCSSPPPPSSWERSPTRWACAPAAALFHCERNYQAIESTHRSHRPIRRGVPHIWRVHPPGNAPAAAAAAMHRKAEAGEGEQHQRCAVISKEAPAESGHRKAVRRVTAGSSIVARSQPAQPTSVGCAHNRTSTHSLSAPGRGPQEAPGVGARHQQIKRTPARSSPNRQANTVCHFSPKGGPQKAPAASASHQ